MTNELPSVTNTEKPLFDLDLGPKVPRLSPRSFDELDAWIDHENGAWQWVRPIEQSVPDIALQVAEFGQIKQWIAESRADIARGIPDPPRLGNIQSVLRQKYIDSRALHSSSPEAKFLATMNDKKVAGHALRMFLDRGLSNYGDPAAVRGAFAALSFENELQNTAGESRAAAFDELKRHIEGEHEVLRRQAGALADTLGNTATEMGQLHIEQRKTFEAGEATRKGEFQFLLNDAKSTLASVTETYDKKLALQSAVTYLRKMSRSHDIASRWWGAAAVLLGIAFVVVALQVGIGLFGGKDLPWNKVAVGVLSATLMFWFLRIVVRIFLSHFHLATDMRGRATMMETYLALLREAGGLKDDDRELILGILFRPTSDGLVRDDAAPASPWDILSRAVGGTGK